MNGAPLRDRFAVWVCNFLLNRVATSEFSDKLKLLLEYGMTQAEAGNVPGLVVKQKET